MEVGSYKTIESPVKLHSVGQNEVSLGRVWVRPGGWDATALGRHRRAALLLAQSLKVIVGQQVKHYAITGLDGNI